MTKGREIKKIMLFANGNTAVFDKNGQQVADLQKSWINFEALQELAAVAVESGCSIVSQMPYPYLAEYMQHFREYGLPEPKEEL